MSITGSRPLKVGAILLALAIPAIVPTAAAERERGGRGAGAVVDFHGQPGSIAASGDRIADLRAVNVGNGLVRVARPVKGLVIEDVTVDGVYRVLENFDRDHTADMTGLRMERITATNVERGLARIGSNSSNGVIRDAQVTFRAQPALRPHLPVGIGFTDSAHDFLVERVIVRGARMEEIPGKYTNGDGFSTERGNSRIRFLSCEAWDNSDGGFDLKGAEGEIDRAVAGRNHRNFRFWSSIEAGEITSIDARNAHIFIDGRIPPTIWIRKLVVRSTTTAPIFRIERGTAAVVIDSHDIEVPPTTKLILGSGLSVDWGPQGPPKL